MTTLTVKKLESLTAADIGNRLSDGHSLFGIVKGKRAGISVLFRWRYRFGGLLRDYCCGSWPTRSLKEIRETRDQAKQMLARGNDPNEEKRVLRLTQQAAQLEAMELARSRIAEVQRQQSRTTVRGLFEQWVMVELRRRRDHGQEVRRAFEKDVLPLLGDIPVEDIRKGHITSVTDVLLARDAARMAKVVLSDMRQMFRYAVDHDMIEHDPTTAIRKTRIGGATVERDRVLSDDELQILVRSIPDASITGRAEVAIWLALATTCRIGELLRAEWMYVQLEAREWFIPPHHSKNGLPHTVHLSDFAIEQFDRLHALTGKTMWCFPNRYQTDHVCVKTVTKQVGDRQRDAAGRMSKRSNCTSALLLPGGKWTPHDLRRTGATIMTRLGVLPEVADRCLNHVEASRVKRIYQRYTYDREKRQAWHLLGNFIAELVVKAKRR